MVRKVIPFCTVFACAGWAFGQMSIPILTEDFESGLDAWTARVFDTGGPNNNTPIIFTANDPLLYDNIGNPGSHSAGYSSNLNPWDEEQPQYLRRQMPAAVPPGTYELTFEVDAYVYFGPNPPPDDPWSKDPWGVGNRTYVLFDDLYNNPGWNYDGAAALPNIRRTLWPGDPHAEGDPTWQTNANWQHITVAETITTTTGNIELRLLMHEKHSGPQAVAWDNLQLTLKQNGSTVFSFSDDFESGLGNWQNIVGLTGNLNNDIPMTFTPTDPLLYLNADNPGSTSGGYSSNLDSFDQTTAAWLQQQLPGVLEPGTYRLRLEMDVYRYKDPERTDPWGLGNRVYVLTDDQYDDPTWNFDTGDPSPGFRLNYWSGWSDDLGAEDWSHNGTWQHVVVERDLTTTTGNIEVRLLMHDKYPQEQAVAWDNISLTVITPCNAPRFDIDGDDDVDQEDFGIFQTCFTGTDAPEIGNFETCRCMNTDGDTDIDSTDLIAFTNCASAPTVAADKDCDDGLAQP